MLKFSRVQVKSLSPSFSVPLCLFHSGRSGPQRRGVTLALCPQPDKQRVCAACQTSHPCCSSVHHHSDIPSWQESCAETRCHAIAATQLTSLALMAKHIYNNLDASSLFPQPGFCVTRTHCRALTSCVIAHQLIVFACSRHVLSRHATD